MRRIVDLPQPDGPSSDRKEFFGVPRSVSDSAVTEVRPIVNCLDSPCRLMPVAVFGSYSGQAATLAVIESVERCVIRCPSVATTGGVRGAACRRRYGGVARERSRTAPPRAISR